MIAITFAASWVQSLPGCARQGGADRGDQTGMGIGGDELDPAQAAGTEVAEGPNQPAPSSLVVTCRPEDLAVSTGVDAGRDQGADRNHLAALADLEDQRVRGHERERAGSWSGRVRNCSTCSSSSAAITETRDLVSPVTLRDCTSLSIRRVETPST